VNTGALWPTPEQAKAKVLRMQTKLQRWAGKDHDRRFDDLYNLVHDPAFLVAGWQLVKHNRGARSAGVDGLTVGGIERQGVEQFLDGLREELHRREFRPQPVRERMIPKANGKLRRLGIPTVRDRVVQATLKMVLEPIFEEDFQPFSYGFRPGRRAHDAIAEIVYFGNRSYEWVLEGDIEACFDNLDHTALLDCVRRRVGDRKVMGLVKAFLKAGILSELGHASETPTGTPQGGILSPLLANIALSKLDDLLAQDWHESMADPQARRRRRQRGEGNWRLVRYADDWVVLISGTHEHAVSLRQRAEEVLASLGLRLSESKTKITHLDEGIDFLGFHIQRKNKRGTEKRYTYTHPSAKALKGIRQRVRERTRRGTGEPAEVVKRINGQLRGFCNYFRFAVSKRAFGSLEWQSLGRVSRWLRKLHAGMTWRDFDWRFIHHWTLTVDGVSLFRTGTVPVRRYRYRGAEILNPWQRLAARVPSPA
jgi:RNA-directed DNA polymerase